MRENIRRWQKRKRTSFCLCFCFCFCVCFVESQSSHSRYESKRLQPMPIGERHYLLIFQDNRFHFYFSFFYYFVCLFHRSSGFVPFRMFLCALTYSKLWSAVETYTHPITQLLVSLCLLPLWLGLLDSVDWLTKAKKNSNKSIGGQTKEIDSRVRATSTTTSFKTNWMKIGRKLKRSKHFEASIGSIERDSRRHPIRWFAPSPCWTHHTLLPSSSTESKSKSKVILTILSIFCVSAFDINKSFSQSKWMTVFQFEMMNRSVHFMLNEWLSNITASDSMEEAAKGNEAKRRTRWKGQRKRRSGKQLMRGSSPALLMAR